VRTSTVVMIAFAVVFGLLAVFVAQAWINNQAESRMKSLEAQKKPIATRTIVVAAKPLRFGTELTAAGLREIPWAENAVPSGAFSTIAELTGGQRRAILSPIESNEPVLSWKITGPGQRATLSAVLREGFKAVTVRVNDVDGVAGFVLPGDHVDVVLTRQADKNAATTDVVLQNARVLAVDQSADERAEKPAVVKAVTLEVDTTAAQKLSLAASVGNLSLVLRKAGEANSEFTRRVTLSDLSAPSLPAAQDRGPATNMTTVSVTRASAKQEYSVPVEGTEWRAAVSGGAKVKRN
jgi:pilus assembly protein CpaB